MGIDGDPRSLQITTSFANNSFLSPWNGTTVFSGGKFIHDNTTNGGTAGALTEDVTSLLTAMSLGGSRYGTEFYIASYTMGSGTANSGNVAGTYLMTVNSNFLQLELARRILYLSGLGLRREQPFQYLEMADYLKTVYQHLPTIFL